MNLHSSLTAAWDWSKEWSLPINPAQCNYLTIVREVSLRFVFFPDGSGTPIPVSKLVKDLGVQTDNMFSPSTQCKKGKTNDFHDKVFLPRSFEIGFYSIIRNLSASKPRIRYVSRSPNLVADINHLEQR